MEIIKAFFQKLQNNKIYVQIIQCPKVNKLFLIAKSDIKHLAFKTKIISQKIKNCSKKSSWITHCKTYNRTIIIHKEKALINNKFLKRIYMKIKIKKV